VTPERFNFDRVTAPFEMVALVTAPLWSFLAVTAPFFSCFVPTLLFGSVNAA
jgi:hypothetical protein